MGGSEGTAAFVYTPELAEGKLRASHPLKLGRVRTCYELLEGLSAFGSGRARVVPEPASVEAIRRVHTAEYVELVRRLSERPERADGDLAVQAMEHGLAPEGDTPPYEGMYEYQLLVSGASL